MGLAPETMGEPPKHGRGGGWAQVQSNQVDKRRLNVAVPP